MKEISEIAYALMVTAEAIVKYYLGLAVRPSCIVLLGRDCWPLFPLIKKAGIPVQYFLWSRLQLTDKNTEEQWRAEVPKGALVVDSGYEGSIFRNIQKIDGSCQFVLVSSSSSYPQIDVAGLNNQCAAALETLPKLTPRAKSYQNTHVQWSVDDDADVDFREEMSIVDILTFNKELLTELGLSLEWAYFTGTTQEERLGKKIKADVFLKTRIRYKGVYYRAPIKRSDFHVRIARKLYVLTGENPKHWKYNLEGGKMIVAHKSWFVTFELSPHGLTVTTGEEKGFAPALPIRCAEIAHIPNLVVNSYKHGYYIGTISDKPIGFLYKPGHFQLSEACPDEGYYAPEYI